MKNVDTRYWVELAVITLVLALAAWVVFGMFFPAEYPPVLPFMLALLVILTAAGQVVLSRLLREKFSKFNSAFLIYKSLKILVLMAFLIIYSTLHRDRVIAFLGSTFVMYLAFMFFESRSLNRHSRREAER
jgi:O-antigen/teichoic acid export membrane protein